MRAGVKFINIPFYSYLDLTCLLSSLFGGKNVHLLVSENLRKNPVHELDRLTKFLGVKNMDSQSLHILGERSEKVQRNNVLYDEARDAFISSGKKEEVFEYFKVSNELLSKANQLELEKHGYY